MLLVYLLDILVAFSITSECDLGCLVQLASVCVCVWMCGCVICVDVWMCECVDVWMCGCVDVWMCDLCGCVDVWMCGCVDV